MNPKHVLVINHYAVPVGALGGGTRHVEVFGRLHDWQWKVLASNRNIHTGEAYRSDEQHLVTVYTTPLGTSEWSRLANWLSFSLVAFFRGLVQRPRPLVVYGSSPHLFAGLSAWAIARARRASFVLEVRDIWPLVLADMGRLDPRSRTYRWLEKLEHFLYRAADRVVVLAEGTADYLAARGVRPQDVAFIPNGASPADFEVDENRDVLRSQLGLDGFVFVYAGAHGVANGLDLVIDAADEIRHELPDVTFLLIGGGPEKTRLERRVTELGLTNVRFHDPVPATAIPRFLKGADFGLHVLADVPLFRYGVSPNTVHDYMAAGLPVLTNTPGEVGSLVGGAGAGIAVPPDGLASGVRAGRAADGNQLRQWGAAGRDYMQQHRSREVLGERLRAVLESLDRP